MRLLICCPGTPVTILPFRLSQTSRRLLADFSPRTEQGLCAKKLRKIVPKNVVEKRALTRTPEQKTKILKVLSKIIKRGCGQERRNFIIGRSELQDRRACGSAERHSRRLLDGRFGLFGRFADAESHSHCDSRCSKAASSQ